MFRGTYEHAVDAKGRTSLPSRFREVLGAMGPEELVITHGPDRSLWCYPPAAWRAFEDRVRAMPQFRPDVRLLMHAVVAPAQDCAVDKAGRVLVPPTLRAHAGIGESGDVMWVGMLDRIELWSRVDWNANLERTRAGLQDPSFMQTLGELGL